MEQNNFKMYTDREHVLERLPMYAGASKITSIKDYVLTNNVMTLQEIEATPAILKLIYELIDNSVDEYIRTAGKFSNKIDINIDKNIVQVIDNGRGIPVTQVNTYKGTDWQPKLSWTELKAGNNFESDDATTIGTFGVGSSLCSILSTEFIGVSNDGENICIVNCKNNNTEIDTKVKETPKHKKNKTGCDVTMKLDMSRFNSGKYNDIDNNHMKLIEQRLLNLSITYPGITFKMNNKKIQSSSKDYLSLFGENISYIDDNIIIGISISETDEFQQFSLVNGLTISDGGNHVNYILDNIIPPIREKLVKKYKTIKPGDIKSKIKLVSVFRNFPKPEYNSQTKEKLTNSKKDISEYTQNIGWDKLTRKILSDKLLMEQITEVYRIKEEFKKRQELKSLKKDKKKINSPKYLPSIGRKKYLMITEGASATGGLQPVLGRKECGYYELKGVPLNAYVKSQSDFTKNKELSELYQIIKNEGYEYIVIATDQDLDGFKIRGLLFGFFEKYLPEYKGTIGMLQTPVIGIKKNNKLVRWTYNLYDSVSTKSGEVSKYYKGLGSWKENDLKYVVEQDGIEEMVELVEWDDLATLHNWLDSKTTDIRKEYIKSNKFSITKL